MDERISNTDEDSAKELRAADTGKCGFERAHPRLQAPALHQSENLTLADQLKSTGNQTQPMLLSPIQESTSQVNMTNSIHWVNTAYLKIQQIKEMHLSQLITTRHQMQAMRRQATDAEEVNKCERVSKIIEMTTRLFNASKSDLLQMEKEKVTQILNETMMLIFQVELRNAPYAKQTHQVEASGNHIEASQIQQTENHLQVNNPQGSLQQPSRPVGLPQSSFNSFNVGSSAGVLHEKRNEDTKLRRFVGINQKRSPVPPLSSSPYAISPKNPQQSSLQIELKDLSSMFPRSATPSSASLSAFLSPLTPLTPLTPSSMTDSLMNRSKLAKNPAAASQLPSQNTNRNQLATDTQRSTKSCLQRKSASFRDKQSSKARDPLKRLVEVVKSVSSKALNAAIRDIEAVTSLTDRVAENVLRCKPTKIIIHDLADDIAGTCDKGASVLKHSTGMKSGMKRELDTVALDGFATDTDLNASGSIKRLKTNNLLLEEIKEINKKLIKVVVDVITEEDVSRPGSDEGTIIRCSSYIPVGFLGNIKIPYTSKLMFPNLLLEVIVSADYPNSSPTVLEKAPSGFCDSEEGRYMWMKAKENFNLSLRKLTHPLSVKDLAESWDVSARKVFHEFVDQLGGGSFSSTYGKWENLAVTV